MTAASVAALTVYDMVKGVERGVEMGGVRLVSKSGGKSGEWHPPGPGRRRRHGRTGDRATARPGGSPRAAGGRDPAGARPHGQRRGGGRRAARMPPARSSSERLKDLGFAVERARSAPMTCRRIWRPSTPARRVRAGRHDRRDRPDPARRDAAGDAGVDRPRGPGPRRGDARRRPRDHAAGRPVAGIVGVRGRALIVNLPGQPQGRARVAGGDRARPRPRARDAGRPVRPWRGARAGADAGMLRAVRRGPVLPARLPAVLGRGPRLLPGDGPPPAGVRRGARRRSDPVRRHPDPVRRAHPLRVHPDADVPGPAGPV